MKPLDLLSSSITAASATEPDRPFAWSGFQEDIFEAGSSSSRNLIIEAVAGSGKSTTLTELMNKVPGSGIALAFNKSVADELRTVVPAHVEARTFNSFGASLLPAHFRGKLDRYKFHNLIRDQMSRQEYQLWGSALVSAINSHQNAAGPIDMDSFAWEQQIGDNVEIPIDRISHASFVLESVWNKHIETVDEAHTFGDQLWYPVLYNLPFPAYSAVYVDEAQDLNSIKHEFVSRLAAMGARVIAVGDTHQAIYAFAGALTTSMAALKDRFDCEELPLSVCYRCDTDIVAHAKKLVPHISAREGADPGTVAYTEREISPHLYPTDALVMCRTNAPLFELARAFINARIPCRMFSNYGRGLVNFVKTMKANTADELASEIKKWATAECLKAERDKKRFRISSIEDKRDCLLPFCEEFKLKAQVVNALERLLTSKSGTLLSTIHKAKGLEADHAYLIRPDLCPAPWVPEGTEEFEQEQNLLYVAITRGKHSFTYVNQGEDEGEQK